MQFDGKPRAVMDLLQGGLGNVSGQTSDSVSYPHYSHEEYHFDTHLPYSEEYYETHDHDYEDAYDFHPYDYEHHQDGQHDHFFYEPTFDFDHYERVPVSMNTGLGGSQSIFKTFEGKFRTENIYDDESIDRSIEHLLRGELSGNDSQVKMWDSGIVDLITDNWSAVMEHSQI